MSLQHRELVGDEGVVGYVHSHTINLVARAATRISGR